MITFFDYVFYKLYRWNVAQNKFIKALGPYQDDPLFAAIFGMSVLQTFNAYTILTLVAIGINKQQWVMRIDYLLWGLAAFFYLFNYCYYQRTGYYKKVLRVYAKRKVSNIQLIIYFILSVTVALLTLFYFKSIKS